MHATLSSLRILYPHYQLCQMGLVTRRTWFPEGLWRLDFNVSFFVQENSFFFSHICMIDAAHFRHQGANIHLAEVTFKEFVMRSIGYRYLQQKKKANHCLKSSHPVWDVTAGHAIGAWAISPVPVTTSGATGIWIDHSSWTHFKICWIPLICLLPLCPESVALWKLKRSGEV